MKIISWNVAGIRAVLKKKSLDFIFQKNIDVVCFQETKAEQSQVKLSSSFLNFFPYQTWNHSTTKKGYSGTAIWSKIPFISIVPTPNFDIEGRICAVEYDDIYLVTVYTPNSKGDLSRLDERINIWDVKFREFCVTLNAKKPCIICGDFNVCHKDIDIHNPEHHIGNSIAGFTQEERKSFDLLLNNTYVDAYRLFNKNGGNYTWWSYMFGARKKNLGWRLDYFIVSKQIETLISASDILSDIIGSDHCPISLDIKINNKKEENIQSQSIDISKTQLRRRSYSYPTPPDIKDMIKIIETRRGNLPKK